MRCKYVDNNLTDVSDYSPKKEWAFYGKMPTLAI
jgi:hypothetical protein